MSKFSLRHLTDIWKQNDLHYTVMKLEGNAALMISERGGRIMGPFFDLDDDGIFWLNPALADPGKFHEFLAENQWNMGGDRFWIAPEVQYIYQDRTRPAESTAIPPAMDPGSFRLEQAGGESWRLTNQMALEAFNTAQGIKSLQLEVVIRPAADPLRFLSEYHILRQHVRYTGYDQYVVLKENNTDDIMSSAWNVIEIQPGGQVIIPISPLFETANYESLSVDENYQSIHPGYVALKVTGDRIYKTGYQAAHVTGRFGYYHETARSADLIIRSFSNNPSSPYFEEASDRPGRWGSSLFVYNDNGSYGGYGEMECFGQTIGGRTGRSSAADTFSLWLYRGDPVIVRRVAAHLLGVQLA
jgi:hypothetical protein